MLVLQLVLYCLLFIFLVKCATGNNGINCLYFYPKEFIDEAQKRGLADKDAVMKKGKQFMVPFCIIMLVVLIAMIAIWNQVTDFRTAYVQAVIFLVVMNWFDGIVIDKLWVGYGKIWHIEGMEDVPYVKPWKYMLVKRGIGTVLYFVIALAVAGIVVLVGKI